MADFRASVYGLALEAQPRMTAAFTPQSHDVYANPPDAYEHALKALRKARR
jgi:hypothetical protein